MATPTAPANEEWQIVHQIMIPKIHRREILHLAHAWPHGYQQNLSENFEPFLLARIEEGCHSVL